MAASFVFAAGFLLRIALIHAYPAIFGGDSVGRLAYHDRILIAQQLPALQATIFALSRLTEDPLIARYWMALLGAAAGAAFYYLARDLAGEGVALPAGLLFATHPYLTALSTVPYSEILMLGALCAAFHYHFAGRPLPASIALGLACLTRYEAWAACPVLALDHGRHRGRWVSGALLFGWAPAAWMLFNAGLSQPGTVVIDLPRSPERLVRYAYVAWIVLKFTPLLTLALAAFALRRIPAGPHRRPVLAFFALFLAALPFSAHGAPPDPERYITGRTAHVPLAALLLLAGVGVARLPRYRRAALAAACLFGAVGATLYLRRETSDPRVRLAFETARYLDQTLGPGETALILSPEAPPQAVAAFLERARRSGPEAERGARRILDEVAGPHDYLRTLVHCRAARRRLVSRPGLPADWLVVWSDYAGPPVAATGRTPEAAFRADSLEVRVYRLRP